VQWATTCRSSKLVRSNGDSGTPKSAILVRNRPESRECRFNARERGEDRGKAAARAHSSGNPALRSPSTHIASVSGAPTNAPIVRCIRRS